MARLVFLGTPEAGVAPLRTLVAAGHEVALVVSRADKRRGRGGALTPSPVKRAAIELGLAVSDSIDDVVGAGAELGVVVAYGRIIPTAVLDRIPMVNVHFSLLPRWRGAAPVERAILSGDTTTGVCLMAVDSGLDTGAVYAEEVTPIDSQESAAQLRQRLVDIGCRLLEVHLARGRAGLPEPRIQVGRATYAEKIRPDELRLDWGVDAVQLGRVVQLGRAWTTFRRRRLQVLRVHPSAEAPPGPDIDSESASPAIGDIAPGTLSGESVVAGGGTRLRLVTVQPEGRQPMAVADWLRGVRPVEGERFGE
jgi:methionyl-tRNA formyltransferase